MGEDPGELFERLARSEFRRRFRLRGRELEHLRRKGLEVALGHAADFIEKRLAPSRPAKWHGLPKGRPLTGSEKECVLRAIRAWLVKAGAPNEGRDRRSRRAPVVAGYALPENVVSRHGRRA